jgi:hypothetical protein
MFIQVYELKIEVLCLIKYHAMKTYPVLNETPRHEYLFCA